MISKKIQCPNCKNKISIDGNPGEKKIIICSNCNQKGKYIFPINKNHDNIEKNSNAISVKNLTKKYNGINAVNNISFNIKKGEIFGFLGPNGAGKTTTIKSILGLVNIDSGLIKINEYNILNNVKISKKKIGYLPEHVAFYDNLTAYQNLCFIAEMKKSSKDECRLLIEEFGLSSAINKKVGTFSKGMIQRLGMARALIGTPEILLLDEPSGGLDPRGVVLIRRKIREMKKKGTTIMVSSHILSEIQEICDRVLIINKGEIVAQDTVDNLRKTLNIKPKITIELEELSEKIIKSVKAIKGIEKINIRDNNIDVICDSKNKARVIITIEKNGGKITNIKTKDPTLEEVFMKITEGD
jgi:ABC-type multidrug transport system ATPase subunit